MRRKASQINLTLDKDDITLSETFVTEHRLSSKLRKSARDIHVLLGPLE